MKSSHLNQKALGLSFGAVWGLGLFLLGCTAMRWGWGDQWVTLLGDVYLGYTSGLQGAFVGFLWGFADGFIGGWAMAWVYNKVA